MYAVQRTFADTARNRTPVAFSGRYINLDRSPLRRVRLEQQLRNLGIAHAYARFPAIDGTHAREDPGTISQREYGCFASHAQLLREAGSFPTHLHVLEDDALLSPEFVPAVAEVIDQGVLEEFDLLFTDLFVSWDPLQMASLERARRKNTRLDPRSGRESLTGVTVFNLHHKGLACTSSYLVARRSIERVAELLDSALVTGPSQPVDLVMRQLVDTGVLKAACLVPFVTSVALEVAAGSTVHGALVGAELSRLACTVLRHTLFVRPDWAAIERILTQYFPPEEPSPRGYAIGRIMQFLASGNATSF
jgi:GR25 family glycosyltransferase involved in LPS biosynthesis